jgi:hypothetical protein
MHGGASTGPRTVEGVERIRQARMAHRRYSGQMVELRRVMAGRQRLERAAELLNQGSE